MDPTREQFTKHLYLKPHLKILLDKLAHHPAMAIDLQQMLDMMTGQTHPGQMGQHPEYGEDILEVARHLE